MTRLERVDFRSEGERLLYVFLEREGLTSTAFAAKLRYHRSAITHILCGNISPSPKKREAIERATGGFVAAGAWDLLPKKQRSKRRTAAPSARAA